MNLIKNKKNGGSKNYEELPLEISEYNYITTLDKNEKKYYSQQCFYKKNVKRRNE